MPVLQGIRWRLRYISEAATENVFYFFEVSEWRMFDEQRT